MTDTLFGERVHKSSTLIDAIGTLDELNAWIGFSAKSTQNEWSGNYHETVQKNLVSIMGELSAGPVCGENYKEIFFTIGEEQIKEIESIVKRFESTIKSNGWARPTSHWDVAARVCRRAERVLWKYQEQHTKLVQGGGQNVPPMRHEILIYINRLSDLLWIWGRM